MMPLAAIDWHSVFFLVFAGLACGCAVAVVAAENVVRMALYLVFSLGATAGLFFLAGAEFVGAMQLMIYVGGTLVLLVFGVMLTAQAPFVSIKTAPGDRVLAGVIGAALLAVLLQSAFSVAEWRRPAAAGYGAAGHACGRGPGGRSRRCAERLPAAIRNRVGSPPRGLGGCRVSGPRQAAPYAPCDRGGRLDGAAGRRCRPRRRGSRGGAWRIGVGRRAPLMQPLLSPLLASLLTEPVGVTHYLVVGAILFTAGVACMAVKRNALGVLMGIELVLNGANVNFVAFASPYLQAEGAKSLGLDGQAIALFVILLAAAEAAVALAITLNFYNNHATVDVDRADDLKG